MFFLCGYDFCRDGNSLNPSPITKITYDNIKLTNGIFTHWYTTRDIESPYTSEEPTAWDYLTVMDANFNGTLEDWINISFLSLNLIFFLKCPKLHPQIC